jgi:lipopolysaccharide/colanic/teichoic acid biosynthesis glycosyltransferase
VRLDIEYIEKWSLAFDLKIVARTCLIVFRDPNAY